MRSFTGFIALLLLVSGIANARQTYIITGQVIGHHNDPLQGATLFMDHLSMGEITDESGFFRMKDIPAGEHVFQVTYIGYTPFIDTILVEGDQYIEVHLEPAYLDLQEVVITDRHTHRQLTENPLNMEIINDEFMTRNFEGHLAKTLERLPGVSAMNIGSGQAKPVIRGLGFNRVVVTENGIKHEGQQWGSDHGLEIDQFAFDRIEVIKGPSSLLYGSDAIAGVINLEHRQVPANNTVGGEVSLTGMTNNRLMGSSSRVYLRRDAFHFNIRGTYMNYADFRVPADSVDIYLFRVPLHKGRARNTAGEERNFHISAGYLKNGFSAKLFVSRVETTSGFFANAHGQEPRNIDEALHDQSARDILYPRQEADHWKVIGRTSLRRSNYTIESDIGYQQNRRFEFSEYTSHGFMPPVFPDTLPFGSDLDRAFRKNSLDANVRMKWDPTGQLQVTTGLNASLQDNTIDGRGFIIPAFTSRSTGGYVYGKYEFSGQNHFHAGVRYDVGNVQTKPYYDWFTSIAGTQDSPEEVFLQRAMAVDRQFSNLSWSVGFNHNSDRTHLKVNAGKSFRMPIAKELAANGVNYHHFRFEVGNPDLKPEEAYQLDAGFEWQSAGLAVGVTPYVNYFSNYIYLNPGYELDRLYGNGNQVFRYSQARVLRYGGELHSHYQLLEFIQLGIIADYLFAVQLSGDKEGFTLPFSPPPGVLFNVKYTDDAMGRLKGVYLSADLKKVFRQDRIVPPESATDGYFLVNLGIGGELNNNAFPVKVSVRISNLLNRKYFNHTSYYRIINMPELGRNITLNVAIPFSGEI